MSLRAPRGTRRAFGAALLLVATACVQWSYVQEEASVEIGPEERCPARHDVRLSAPSPIEGGGGDLVSVDEGPVESAVYAKRQPNGAVFTVKSCTYLVTVRYREGG